jgi:hypothetical protein
VFVCMISPFLPLSFYCDDSKDVPTIGGVFHYPSGQLLLVLLLY